MATPTREIGVRAALGASRGDLVRLVGREMAMLAFAAVAVGAVASAAVAHRWRDLLFATPAHDPMTFAAVAVTMLFVALLAAAAPARHAAAMNPLEAIRR